jgi:hypothetical protein
VVDTFKNKDGKEKKVKRELRFLDSFKFMASSLDKLTKGLGKDDFENLDLMTSHYTTEQREILKQKGVYPYEYMNEFDRLEETSLPPKCGFFSSLTSENISDTDYRRAQNVWNTFGMKTMRDYHDLYLKTDVLLLTDIMENIMQSKLRTRSPVVLHSTGTGVGCVPKTNQGGTRAYFRSRHVSTHRKRNPRRNQHHHQKTCHSQQQVHG